MRLALFLLPIVVLAQDDPDIPARFRHLVNSADYHRLRDAHVSLLRGLPADPELRQAAVARLRAQRQQALRAMQSNGAVPPVWRPIGPSPIPNGPVSGGLPVTGRVTAFEIHPANPDLLYLGTAQGGVYRSTNAGLDWTPIFDSAATSAIGSLKIDPNAPSRLWIGTGEANGSLDSFAGVGLYRCDSCDTTPVLTGPVSAFKGRSISSILVSPGNSNVVFVGVAGGVMGIGGEAPLGGTIPPLPLRGLYRLANAAGALASITVERLRISNAGGCYDTPCTGNRNVDSMVFDPADSTGNTLIVWQNGTNAASDGGVWRSTNAQAPAASVTFTQTFATTATSQSNGRGVLSIYRPPTGPSVVYVASGEPATGTNCSNSSSNSGALRKSTDGGLTFSAKIPASGGFCGGQCFYNLGLEVVPGATPANDKIFLGGQVSSASCSRINAISTDSGASFFNSDTGLHADTHFIRATPGNPSIVYHGNDGGIFKSTDGGLNWISLNNSQLNAVQFQSLAVHPTDARFSLGGTQDNGTNLRRSDGTWRRVDFGDGGYALVDSSAPDATNVTMYHTYFNASGLLLAYARVDSVNDAFDGNWAVFGCGSANPGNNGIGCNDAVLFYAPMATGPGTPNTVYYGSDRLYRSNSKGATHTVVSQAPLENGVPVSTIAISPQDDNYRLVGLANGSIYYTTTGNPALVRLGAGTLPAKYAGRVKFDPSNKNTAWLAFGGYFGNTTAHVWKVTNLGTTPLVTAAGAGLPDVPVNALAIDPADSNTVYAGTDIGVYVSSDAGASWLPFGEGLPAVAVFGMEIQPTARLLRIATHGRGMWEAALDSVPTDAPDLTLTKAHGGAFTLGQTGAIYTLTVRNNGTVATSGAVTVTETLPAGLNATGIQGPGWTCVQPAGPCTRADSLAPGGVYPVIALTVSVAANAPASLTNCATVTGGGQTASANDTGCDPTSIAAAPAAILLLPPASLNPGDSLQFPITLSTPAPAGGLFVSVSVSDPSVATLSAPFVVIDGGQTLSTRLRLVARANGSVTVTASALGYTTGTITFRIGSVAAPALSIVTTSLSLGSVGTAYSQLLAATGGTPPYVWSLTSGTLPAGLQFNASGAITGTPTASGTVTLGLRVTDSANPAQTADTALALTVTNVIPAPNVVTATGGTPQAAPAGSTFASPLQATVRDGNGQPVVGVVVTFAAPAAGPSGTFQGSGTAIASTVTNGSGVAISPLLVANANVGAWTATARAAGASTPAVFNLANTAPGGGGPALSLPALLTLNPGDQTPLTVTLPGPAPAGGVFVTLQNSNPAVASLTATTMFIPEGVSNTTRARVNGLANGIATVTATAPGYTSATAEIRVGNPSAAPLSIATTSLPDGRVGSPYSFSLAATGGTPPYAWSLTAGAVPAGLNIAGNTITGVPTAPVTATPLSFRVTDASNPSQSATLTLPLTIQSAPVGPAILLPETITLSPGGSTPLPVTLSTAAPADGLFVSVTNSNPAAAGVSTSFFVISGGLTGSTRARLSGLAPGTSTIIVSAPGYTSASTRVTVN